MVVSDPVDCFFEVRVWFQVLRDICGLLEPLSGVFSSVGPLEQRVCWIDGGEYSIADELVSSEYLEVGVERVDSGVKFILLVGFLLVHEGILFF